VKGKELQELQNGGMVSVQRYLPIVLRRRPRPFFEWYKQPCLFLPFHSTSSMAATRPTTENEGRRRGRLEMKTLPLYSATPELLLP
jgi:hypothetical protein